MKMSNVVAYAATLLASACVEATKSIGATKAHVDSAVNSGLAAHSSANMITLTASTATSNVHHMYLCYDLSLKSILFHSK